MWHDLIDVLRTAAAPATEDDLPDELLHEFNDIGLAHRVQALRELIPQPQ